MEANGKDIISVENVQDGVLITFSDGICALFTAKVLRTLLGHAMGMVQDEGDFPPSETLLH